MERIGNIVPFVGPPRNPHGLVNFSFLEPEERQPMPVQVKDWESFHLFEAALKLNAAGASAVEKPGSNRHKVREGGRVRSHLTNEES
jgi:hypothetical protein